MRQLYIVILSQIWSGSTWFTGIW